ncbi:MAG TPA: prepilin-type N-terminal cleavage/methylation domain-containing protein, partial [Mollicutes bacterium]|nr:prepilin-type N-terminal cleavage/methylation domain-containing protein [Mollicutes bacterium]
MKLNKKGFTLIELLAVIVILAIIMLIATPTILNVIEDARQGAARSSAMGYVDAIEKEIMAKQVTGDAGDLMNTTITDPGIISIRGERPS